MPLMTVSVAATLVGCGPSAEAQSSAQTISSKAKAAGNGVTIQGDGVNIDATVSSALMPGYSDHALSARILGGWVDRAKIARANKETDPAEKKKQSMGSFGTVIVHIAAGKLEPGTYPLGKNEKDPQGGSVSIDKAKDAGLNDDYTAKSGNLTIRSVTFDGKKLTAIEGLYDGQFASSAGDSRAFSGEFRYFPKKK